MRIIYSLALSLSTSLLLAQTPAKNDAVPPPGTVKNVVHVIGLEGVKQNAKGQLDIQGDSLEFQTVASSQPSHGQTQPSRGQIKISSIEDIFTGEDSRQVGGAPLTVIKLAAPFGSGRALSLFAHQKIDNLTIEYRDENNGFHGVIFLLAKGQAILEKKELVAKGAKATIPVSDQASQPAVKKEQK